MPVDDHWQPPPALADSPTVIGGGQAVLASIVLGCVLVLGGFSLGGLADPVRAAEAFTRIDAVRIGSGEPRIHVTPTADQCGTADVVLTCRLEIGGRAIEVRADGSARAARCAVLADGRPMPCMVGTGADRKAGAVVSIVDDLDLAPAEYRRLVSQHDEPSTPWDRRFAVIGPLALALGLTAGSVVFRTLSVERVTYGARRVAAVGAGVSFAAGTICWWVGRLVGAGVLL